jgi:hypothetical protein
MASLIEFHEYVAALRGAIPDGLHPAGMVTIWGSIRDMIDS